MSSSAHEKTRSVIDKIVLLGVLEIYKKQDPFLAAIYPIRDKGYISSKEYVDMAQLNIDTRTVGRYIEKLSEWINEEVEEKILKAGGGGYKSIGELPPKTKRDILSTFLILSQILTEHFFPSIEELMNKPDEDAFTIITKLHLVISKRNDEENDEGIDVELKHNQGEIKRFKPSSFIFDNNKWGITGENICDNRNETISIADIISVSVDPTQNHYRSFLGGNRK